MTSGYRWQEEGNGSFTLYQDEHPVLSASAQAEEFETGEKIDARLAALIDVKKQDQALMLTYENDAGLRLTEYLTVTEAGAIAQCSLSRKDGTAVKTNRLTPLIAQGKGDEPYLWRDLGAKMLLVPYDNDMWMRYETAALRAGRKSYDVTVLMKEDTREGLLIGAMDFDIWKNAIACPGMDARILEARCGQGASDEGSHDYATHGVIEGVEVLSSRFMIAYGTDWRDLLEQYAVALAKERAPRTWDQGVPFGFNSYAGLAHTLNVENFQASGDFVREELTPRGFHNNGETYINLDGGWQRIWSNLHIRACPPALRACSAWGTSDCRTCRTGNPSAAPRYSGGGGRLSTCSAPAPPAPAPTFFPGSAPDAAPPPRSIRSPACTPWPGLFPDRCGCTP